MPTIAALQDLTRPPRPARSVLLGLYLALTFLGAGIGRLLLWQRLKAGKEDQNRWREKLGQTDVPRPDGRLIWVHAVSVGEGLSVLPLLSALTAVPGVTVLLTCTTVTSARLLADRVPQGCILQFLPLDLGPAVRRFLDHWRPDCAVFVESELWPRLIHDTYRRAIPLLLVNARMSDRSADRWQRFPRLARALLGRFTVITAPDAHVAEKLERLGAVAQRVRVVGSLKSGLTRLPVDAAELAALRAAFGSRPLWLAASTHPGEEDIVLRAHGLARAAIPDLGLILAPRHPARGDEVAALCAGMIIARRSARQMPNATTDVFLADTLGEMGLWFDLAPVTLVGGSLVPIGGHNAYEPAIHASAILYGPFVENFADLYARLGAAGAAVQVTSAESIAQALIRLRDGAARATLTGAATAVIGHEDDPTDMTARLILSVASVTS